MKKKTALWIALDLVLLIVFNVVFFVIGGTKHPTSVWISYAFIHVAYLLVLLTPLLVRKSSSAAIFGFSIQSVSSAYFLVEFVVGIIFILLRMENYKPALIVQIILAGIYAVVFIANLIANESTADSEERREQEVAYIKDAASRVKSLTARCPDKKTAREVERLYDLLHASPTRSNGAVHLLELEISNKIPGLEDAVASRDPDAIITAAAEISVAVEERNRKLRLSN